MITFLKDTAGELATISERVAGAWVNVSAPTAAEIDWLAAEFAISPEFISHSLDFEERARVVKDASRLLVVLRVPYLESAEASVPYTTVPVGVIIAPDLLVTICPAEGEVIRNLAKGNPGSFTTGNPGRFLLQLLDAMAEAYLRYVRDINHKVDVLEEHLGRSLRNQEVLALLKYQKSLTFFNTGIKSNMHMLERLRLQDVFGHAEEDQSLLADVDIELRQAMEMIEISDSILSEMMDAFASIISNNINAVMKFLASMTIVLTVPSVISGLYGMNLLLPLATRPQAFTIVTGGALLLSAGFAWVFWKKDWF